MDEEQGTILDRLKAGFRDRYGEGREDYRQAYYASRELRDKDPEDARIRTTLATNPTFVMARDLFTDAFPNAPDSLKSEPLYRGQRAERDMALSQDSATRIGQVGGTIANDLTQDSTRGLYWLLNAPQATGNVINELALATANPDLFTHDVTDIPVPRMMDGEFGGKVPKVYPNQAQLTKDNLDAYQTARAQGLISKEGQTRKGVQSNKDGMLTRRRFDPGNVAALSIPSGVAINAGIGLLNPLGGSGGYAAVLPSDEDPSKTSNVIGEIAAKYILGKTGNLLPYDEFSKHRPDVSREDYNRYKAFKYQKEGDINLFDDGQVTLPTGVIKATMEGIHGPEVQFLGRSLPLTTTITPFLGAVAGGVMGVRGKRPIKHGLIGGTAGLAAGAATGMITEEIRRRAVSNTTQLEGGNAESYLR